jgi:hypothetical protein
VNECKEDHDTSENVEEDVRDVITEWIELPEIVIDCVTQNPNWLIRRPLHICKYVLNIPPTKTPNLRVFIDHRIIPVGKGVIQRIQI